MIAAKNDSTVTGELLRLIAQKGEAMTAAVVVYKDRSGDICWYGSEDLKINETIALLEKVKIELARKL